VGGVLGHGEWGIAKIHQCPMPYTQSQRAWGMGQFNARILDLQFWIRLQSKIQNLKSKIPSP
jgi:hypothetical protein